MSSDRRRSRAASRRAGGRERYSPRRYAGVDRRGVTGAVATSRAQSSSSASASSSCRSCPAPHPSSAALVPPPPPSLAIPTSLPARSRALGGALASSWAIWAQREIGEPTLPEHGAIRSQAGDGDRERLPQTSETGEGRAPVAPAQREPGDGGIAAIPADDPPGERVELGRPGDSQLITSRAHNTERIPTRAHGTAPRGAGSAWMRVSAGCSLAAHADASDPSDDPRRSARGGFAVARARRWTTSTGSPPRATSYCLSSLKPRCASSFKRSRKGWPTRGGHQRTYLERRVMSRTGRFSRKLRQKHAGPR